MARKRMIGIYVSDEEMAKMQKLARYEQLPIATAARKVLINMADELEGHNDDDKETTHEEPT